MAVCRITQLLVLTFVLFFSAVTAQVAPAKITRHVVNVADTLVLDSLSLVPGSVIVKAFPPDSVFTPIINYQLHALIFDKKPDSISVSYQRFPINFEKVRLHKNADDLTNDMSRRRKPFEIQYKSNGNSPLFENDALNKNGNISRGLSFGNNQDVVLNSNLNLQVSGKLSPDIELLMAATDNNIPFQADGTSAQLQEFDKVYIQLNNADSKLIVGDYQLSKPASSYFMNFYKRAQGGYFENTFSEKFKQNNVQFSTRVAAAVSRGKFSRQIFFGVENNQGPYRLKGADNEPFIIVLSGTEKIYVDGKLLQRGQENDYIIDYNTGEITFTARQIITKDKRIVAEFQYAERNYARSLITFGEEIKTKKTSYSFNIYSEQDNKNRPLQQTLSQSQKDVMIAVGDSLQQAYYSGASAVEFNTTNVFYRKTDSIVGAFVYPDVYVFTSVADSVNYALKFSYVGENKGYYRKTATSANGPVYTWVAPLDNLPQGNYEPIIPLVTPKLNQMVVAGISHSFSSQHLLIAEGVYTKNDINTFSSSDKRNDEGSGVKIASKNKQQVKRDSAGAPLTLQYNLNYEFVQQRFKQIERFRSIEFDRDWNRPLTGTIANDQHLASAELGLIKAGKGGINYTYNLFSEGNTYLGKRQNLLASFTDKAVQLQYNGSFLLSMDTKTLQSTQFYRHKVQLSRKLDKFVLAYNDDFERNIFSNTATGDLMPRAYQFYEWEASLATGDSTKSRGKVFYKRRFDKLNYNNKLLDSTDAENIGTQLAINRWKNHPFSLMITYRKLQLKNVVGTSLKPDNTLLNRLEYNPRFLKGLLVAGLFYETGYGLENKRDFYYIEVAPGQGQYAWNDYNGNGIKERNEFEVALYSDQMRYIRIYTPTNDYVKVLQNQFSFSGTLRPSSMLKPKNKFNRLINRFTVQTALRFDNKISDNNGFSNYNPFANPQDSLLQASNNNTRNSLFFNQSSAVFSADFTLIQNQSRQLLTNGIEERTLNTKQLRWRANFKKAWSVSAEHSLNQKGNRSQFFAERNYMIDAIASEQKLAFQPSTNYRLSVSYKFEDKTNTLGEPKQKAVLHTYSFESKFSKTEKGILSARIDWIRITYNADLNSAIAYEMLNGLSVGENFTWELSYQRNLSNNIQISINYNGRKTPTAATVHLGGAQIKAFF